MMKKALEIIAFFLLLEYQVFVGKGEYSIPVAVGLVILCVYEFFTENRSIIFRDRQSLDRQRKQLNMGEKAAAAVYAGILLLGIIFGANLGTQLAFIMISGILGIVIFSLKDKNAKARDVSTWISSFTIPKFYLYLINFLLSVQIYQYAAYHSILLVSCFILYDILNSGEKMAAKANKGDISHREFKHYLFHGWSKYWNFFLWVWFFVALRANGVITAQYEYILLFVFMVVFFTLLMRNENTFSMRDFGVVTLFSALLAGISPLMMAVSKNELPTYVLAAAIFVGFDLADVYFHQREFRESSVKFWSQKAVLYILAAVYISQVHMMMTNGLFGIEEIAASFFQ
jgi:hypothetical protein